VVLSDRLWRRSFGADPGVVGRRVQFVAGSADRGPRALTVIGVLPPEFRVTYPLETEIWVIDSWSRLRRTAAITHTVAIARLRPNVGLTAARARLAETSADVFPSPRDPRTRRTIYAEPVNDWVAAGSRTGLWLIGGVAVLLLVITCVTVGNALLIQVAARRVDLAVRGALGAGRGRIVRQLLAEGAVIATAGAAAGTLLAVLLLPAMRAVLPASIPRGDEVDVNGWWLAFAVAAAGVSTILAALAPAWHGSRLDLATAVKRVDARTSGDRTVTRWRRLLVGVQAAVAAALLTGAALLLVSFWRLTDMPLGFDAGDVVTLEMRLIDQSYRSPDALRGFQDSLLQRVRAIPGVLDAGLTSAVPFRGVDFMRALRPVGGTRRTFGNGRYVDEAYFRVMNVPLVRGRLISADDGPSRPPVTVVSRAFALDMFGTEEAVGREIEPFLSSAPSTPVRVVGVVGDTRYTSYADDPSPALYVSRRQDPSELMCLVVRVTPDASQVPAALVQAVRAIDPAVPAMDVTTVGDILSRSVADRRFYAAVTATFAALALLLTAAGLIVVVSRAVVESRRELALRMALGAEPGRLRVLIAREHVWPVAAGTVLGLLIAAAAVRVISSLLFQVDGRSEVVYGSVALIVLLVGALAAFLPAAASTHVPPAEALRAE
jgi:predicted permease